MSSFKNKLNMIVEAEMKAWAFRTPGVLKELFGKEPDMLNYGNLDMFLYPVVQGKDLAWHMKSKTFVGVKDTGNVGTLTNKIDEMVDALRDEMKKSIVKE